MGQPLRSSDELHDKWTAFHIEHGQRFYPVDRGAFYNGWYELNKDDLYFIDKKDKVVRPMMPNFIPSDPKDYSYWYQMHMAPLNFELNEISNSACHCVAECYCFFGKDELPDDDSHYDSSSVCGEEKRHADCDDLGYTGSFDESELETSICKSPLKKKVKTKSKTSLVLERKENKRMQNNDVESSRGSDCDEDVEEKLFLSLSRNASKKVIFDSSDSEE